MTEYLIDTSTAAAARLSTLSLYESTDLYKRAQQEIIKQVQNRRFFASVEYTHDKQDKEGNMESMGAVTLLRSKGYSVEASENHKDNSNQITIEYLYIKW